MLCNNSAELYWGRDLWHIHTLLSLDEHSKERIIMKRQRFIEGSQKNDEARDDNENKIFDLYPSDDVCSSTEQLFGTHINSLVFFFFFCSFTIIVIHKFYFNRLQKLIVKFVFYH